MFFAFYDSNTEWNFQTNGGLNLKQEIWGCFTVLSQAFPIGSMYICLRLVVFSHLDDQLVGRIYNRVPWILWLFGLVTSCHQQQFLCYEWSHTVDGRNPAPVYMANIPLFTVFYTSQVVQDFFHQQYLGTSDRWSPYSRTFAPLSLHSEILHVLSLKLTAKAPENRPLEKEIPIGNHHF